MLATTRNSDIGVGICSPLLSRLKCVQPAPWGVPTVRGCTVLSRIMMWCFVLHSMVVCRAASVLVQEEAAFPQQSLAIYPRMSCTIRTWCVRGEVAVFFFFHRVAR